MPKFKLTKQPDNMSDSTVEMSFSADSIDIAREFFDDFLRASGFVLREPEDEGTGFMVRGDLEWDKDGELVKPKKLKAIK